MSRNPDPKSIASGDFVYIVTMHRWGDPERHSYALGAYITAHRARIEADSEEDERGGKYSAMIVELRLGWTYQIFNKVIKSMTRQPLIAPAPWARSDMDEFDPEAPYARMFKSDA